MPTETKVSRRDVDAIVRATFPNYRGRKFRVALADHVVLSDLHWSGGTHSEYKFVRIDGKVMALDFSGVAPWSHDMEGRCVSLPPHVACVEHTQFCGSDLGLRITFNPANMAEIPGPARALLTHE